MTHELTANGAALTLTEKGNLAFRPAGGQTWESGGPLCVLHYYDRQHPRAQQVVVPWDDSAAFGTAGTISLSTKSRLDIEPIDARSLRIVMTFDTIFTTIAVRLALADDGSGFDVTIEADGVRENLPRLYRLLGIEILPEFGAARTGEAGYLTLPNWFGCQTSFNHNYPREAWQTIYSSNDQWEHVCNMPVFGITRAQGTMCGLVAQGDYDAQLVCRQHWEQNQGNSVHPYLVWRWQQQDDLIAGPRQLRYRFALPNGPDGEGYVFIGKQYRRFLRTERGLMTWAEKGRTRPEAVDFHDRFFLKIFMAYKDPEPQGRGAYHSTCTCEEARQIIERCLARGMKRLTVVLVGWGQDGHDGKCPTYLPVDERVGGEQAFNSLVGWCRDQGVMLAVHTSHGGAYPCSEEFHIDELIRHRTGEYWESIIWSGGQTHRICPQISLNKYVKRDVPALAALGLHGHHHFDAVGGFVCCHSPLHPVTQRAQYIELARQEFKVALDVMGSVSTEMPFGQYFDVVDGFFHSYSNPSWLVRNCAIGRHFFDRTAPLLMVALHGSVYCGESIGAGDPRRLLEMLDLGLSPQFEVCMRPSPAFGIRAYEKAADALENAYRFMFGPQGVRTRLGDQTVEGRWELAPGVTRTVYSGGAVVRVNRSDKAFEDLQPNSYDIQDGQAAV